jgi:hypothetical protein
MLGDDLTAILEDARERQAVSVARHCDRRQGHPWSATDAARHWEDPDYDTLISRREMALDAVVG